MRNIPLIGGPLAHKSVEVSDDFNNNTIKVIYTDISSVTAFTSLDDAVREIECKYAYYDRRCITMDKQILNAFIHSDMSTLRAIQHLIEFYCCDNIIPDGITIISNQGE